MDDLWSVLSGLLRLATAVVAVYAAVEARKAAQKTESVRIELLINPAKTIDELEKRVNGNGLSNSLKKGGPPEDGVVQ